MKVLFITHSYFEFDRREKLQYIVKSYGVDITLLIPKSWPHSLRNLKFTETGKEAFKILAKNAILAGRNNLYFYPLLPFFIFSERPHIIHCEEEPFSFITSFSLLFGKMMSAKGIFFTWQNLYVNYPFPYNLFEFLSYRLANAAIAGNEEAKQIMVRKGFKKPIFVIPQMGINVDSHNSGTQIRLRDTWSYKGMIVGFIGRVVREKGLETVLRALAAMEEEVTFLIIGRGSDQENLEIMASGLSIRDRVFFIDTVPHEEISRYMAALDVLILPSVTGADWKEQFGQVLIEAMACGTPVLGSSSGAIPDVIGDAGIIFKEGDAKDLKEKLKHLMDPAIRQFCARKGMERVHTRFTNEKIASANHDVYRFLLGDSLPRLSIY